MPGTEQTAWKTFLAVLVCGVLALVATGAASATELYIPAIKATSGQTVDVPIMIDEVDNLAGLKVVMKYDDKILTFKKGVKTKHSDALMHIINDKNPGTLIVVMAGARGIKGKDFPILNLSFETKGGLKENHVTTIEISEIEMMSDKLKDIACQVKTNPLVISPEPPAAKSQEVNQGSQPAK